MTSHEEPSTELIYQHGHTLKALALGASMVWVAKRFGITSGGMTARETHIHKAFGVLGASARPSRLALARALASGTLSPEHDTPTQEKPFGFVPVGIPLEERGASRGPSIVIRPTPEGKAPESYTPPAKQGKAIGSTVLGTQGRSIIKALINGFTPTETAHTLEVRIGTVENYCNTILYPGLGVADLGRERARAAIAQLFKLRAVASKVVRVPGEPFDLHDVDGIAEEIEVGHPGFARDPEANPLIVYRRR